MSWDKIVGIILLALAIWSLYDLWFKNNVRSTVGKVLWSLVNLFTQPLGVILYYFFGRK